MSKEYIGRNIYIDKIKPFIDKGIIKVLTGQRRVGKTYLLMQLMDVIKDLYPDSDIIYINKELYDFRNITDYNDLIAYIKDKSGKGGKTFVFIDEVQDIFQFEKALRSLLAEGNYDLYCTGSNAKLLSGELATYLSGRYIEIKIFSLTYQEFLLFQGLENSLETYMKYMKYGGLPYLKNLPLEDAIVYEYLRNIYNTIILKDIVERYKVRNVKILQNLVMFVADNLGSIVSAKSISDYLKSQKIDISVKVIIEYLNYLANVFFISEAKRSEIGGKKVFEIGMKYYFEDIGMRNAIIPFRTVDVNKILENLVYHHLVTNDYSVTVGKSGSKEIDFVATKLDQVIYFQVCYILSDENTFMREFENLLEINDNFPKYVISTDEIKESDYKGIKHLNIRDFLLRVSF